MLNHWYCFLKKAQISTRVLGICPISHDGVCNYSQLLLMFIISRRSTLNNEYMLPVEWQATINKIWNYSIDNWLPSYNSFKIVHLSSIWPTFFFPVIFQLFEISKKIKKIFHKKGKFRRGRGNQNVQLWKLRQPVNSKFTAVLKYSYISSLS